MILEESIVIPKQLPQPGGTYAWKEVKLIKENVTATNAFLYLATINPINQPGFWAISSIRLCNPKGSK